jgi:hypothetical protein
VTQGGLFDEPRHCSKCNKPEPSDWCWLGCRIPGECPLGYFARDIAESPQAVRDIYEGKVPGISIVSPQQYIERTPERNAAREERAHARTGDPITSHEAAASIESDKIRASQEAVWLVLKMDGPMHDQRLVQRYSDLGGMPAQSESGIRTRRKELVTKGKVEDTGQRVVLDSGRKSIVWRAI